MTRHQYGISAFVSQMSFVGETSGSVAKCRPFSQANITNSPRSMYQNSNMTPARRSSHFSLFGLVFYMCSSPCNFVPEALESC